MLIIPNVILTDDIIATKGHIDFINDAEETISFPLFGEWEYYPNTYISNPNQLDTLHNPLYIAIPLTNIIQAEKTATYRITISNAQVKANPVLYLENLDYPITVYLNGVKQESFSNNNKEALEYNSTEIYPLSSYDKTKESQDLVLSVNYLQGNAPLFKRVPTITPLLESFNISYWKTLSEAFLFGFFIFLVLHSFSFMILRPEHLVITCVSIFDSILIGRLFFASENLLEVLESLFTFLHFSDTFVFSAQIFILCIGGIAGTILSTVLFDKKNQISKRYLLPIILCYSIFALIMPLNLSLYYTFGRYFIIALYIYTFIIVFAQISTKKRKTKNDVFHIIQAIYAGIVIFLDLFYLSEYIGFPIFYYPLFIFFYAQMFLKLIDNSNTYLEVINLNQNLELIVERRTKELSDKNKKLSEISTHDPLTSAYNRLYFDEQFEIALTIFDEKFHTLHLCMFDLDHFKSINDTFGHAVGDEQLVYVAKTVQQIVLKNSVFARVGGEEFMILYTESKTDVILENIEKIRSTFDKKSKENKQFTTSSFGVTKYIKGLTKKDFLKIADKNLYEAKSTGRNKIVFH